MNETTRIEPLHDEYCRLAVGGGVRLTLERHYYWSLFMSRGFTIEDLRLVMTYLKGQIRDGKRNPGCLKWCNLIQNVDGFEEELSLARAASRIPKPTPKAQFLASVGRPEPKVEENTKKAGEVAAYWCEQMRKAVNEQTKP